MYLVASFQFVFNWYVHPRKDRAEALSNLAGKKLRAQYFRVGNEKKRGKKSVK